MKNCFKNLYPNSFKKKNIYILCYFLSSYSFAQLDVFLIEDQQPKETSPSKIIETLNSLFKGRVCSNYYRVKNIKLTSITHSCDGDFREQDKNDFLKAMFENKLLLYSKNYKIIKQTGHYTFIFEPDIPVKKRVEIELIFHNAIELWPHRIIANSKLAIYVHDLSNIKDLKKWDGIGIPLSYGILPGYIKNQEFTNAINQSKQEIWMSVSLEPKLVTASMNKFISINEILQQDLTNLSNWLLSSMNSLSNIKGISNRLGSKFTENTLAMRKFFNIFRGKVPNFLDTQTSLQSVAYETAQILSFSSYKRDIDLDFNTKTRQQLESKWNNLLKILKKRKYAIAIVNAHSSQTFRFLKKNIYSVQVKGIEFVKITDLPFEKR